MAVCRKDGPEERLEMIVEKNGNSPELFQIIPLNYLEQIFVPCKHMTPKTE